MFNLQKKPTQPNREALGVKGFLCCFFCHVYVNCDKDPARASLSQSVNFYVLFKLQSIFSSVVSSAFIIVCFYCSVFWNPCRLLTFSPLSLVCPLSLWWLFSKAAFTLSTLKCCVLVPTLLHCTVCWNHTGFIWWAGLKQMAAYWLAGM